MSILTICLACIGNVLIRGLYSGDRKKNLKRVDDIIMYIIGTFTSQGNPLKIKLKLKYSQQVHALSGGYYRSGHKTLGILATVWCLAAFVFVNSYNSVLVSYLSVSYKSPDINSLAQLASSSNHKMVTMKGTVYEIDILVKKKIKYLMR